MLLFLLTAGVGIAVAYLDAPLMENCGVCGEPTTQESGVCLVCQINTVERAA